MTTTSTQHTDHPKASIEAPADLPVIRITRDFAATPAQLFRAHVDPELYKRWVGPDGIETEIDYWNATDGGNWRMINIQDGERYGFHGCFHHVNADSIVQTFTFEGWPDAVSLNRLSFEDLGDGRTRLHASSLFEDFESRDGMLRSGMDRGVNDGYAKLDALLTDTTI